MNWIRALLGLIVGVWLGFGICSLLVIARKADEAADEGTQNGRLSGAEANAIAEMKRLRHIQIRQQKIIRDLREQLNAGKDRTRS